MLPRKTQEKFTGRVLDRSARKVMALFLSALAACHFLRRPLCPCVRARSKKMTQSRVGFAVVNQFLAARRQRLCVTILLPGTPVNFLSGIWTGMCISSPQMQTSSVLHPSTKGGMLCSQSTHYIRTPTNTQPCRQLAALISNQPTLLRGGSTCRR